MNIASFSATVGKRWTTVVAGVLLGLLVAVGILLTSDTVYRSTSQLFLGTPGWGGPTTLGNSDSSPYQGDEFTRQRAQTYVRLIEDMNFSQRVSERLGGSVSPSAVAAHLDVRVVPDTVLLDVTAGDASPDTARDMAVAAAEQLTEDIETLETPAGLRVATVQPVAVGSATVPTEPSSPHTALTLVAGVTVGLLLGLSAMVVRERSRRTVDDAETIVAATGRPVLATIPHVTDEAAFDEFRYDLDYLARRAPSGVLVVSGPGSGVGRTATVAGLGAAYRRAGRSAVIVDADFRSTGPEAASGGVSGVVLGELSLARALTSVDGVAHLVSGVHPAEPARLLENRRFAELLDDLRSRYDVVLVDSPDAGRFDDARTVARLADTTVLTAAAGRTSIDDLVRSVADMRAVGVDVAGTVLTHSRGTRARFGYLAPHDDQDAPTAVQTGTVTR
ncbi:hypothetical protein HQ305_13255 [Rhodococcus sp. BP-149]|uniref:polysaccharide biosynthesis tyrosine autokinase n=2 Tax=Rhodococcus TaxID=1827 RepID=UPI001C9B89B6|nr:MULTISPECIES: polysaccharide biosynthesis tyrosine autokinase [unclassified Rhodococcus (in: high G+C Gram-positive bacteria)]MBY6686524.1 hypothetical protein [Rhodococcus sp. BP-288]MBY6695234.1 hypothetical protein [Rhodococcus sp. BP-188]MBY6700016.1 hypothetical protein [Rhodococcus sp. BP-285]MBY6704961.1 hypothetical protein [Rhodococcus sp. BP-283]MBY6709485.1 hypothetical protein [Rhodococcus sp. BP-241]